MRALFSIRDLILSVMKITTSYFKGYFFTVRGMNEKSLINEEKYYG